MKNFIKSNFLPIFLVIAAAVLYVHFTNNFILEVIFKPLIVISLVVYIAIHPLEKIKALVFAVSGLLFSLLGDVLLLFQKNDSLFFVLGLVAFLVAHLFYIIYYLRSTDVAITSKKLKTKPIIVLAILAFGTLLFTLLFNNLGGLKIPVFAYTAVLISMNLFALNRYGKVSDESFKLIMIGAIFFTLSDSMLAVNKFLLPIPIAKIWILGTYAAAQYFITKGVLSKK